MHDLAVEAVEMVSRRIHREVVNFDIIQFLLLKLLLLLVLARLYHSLNNQLLRIQILLGQWEESRGLGWVKEAALGLELLGNVFHVIQMPIFHIKDFILIWIKWPEYFLAARESISISDLLGRR